MTFAVLVTSATPLSGQDAYTLDGDGKRTQTVATTGSRTTITYAYDVGRSLPVVLQQAERPSLGQPTTHKYVWGLGLAYSVDGTGAIAVDHTDGLGPVRALTDSTGALIQTYQTDEFGVTTQNQGSSTQRLQYTGEERDEDGLVYLRALVQPFAGSLHEPRRPHRRPGLSPFAQPLRLYAE